MCISDASTASHPANLLRGWHAVCPEQMMMILPVGENMKALSRLSVAFCFVFLATSVACRKDTNAKEVANAGQDTMLLHDLAEANRNTATGEAAQNRPSDTKVVPRPSPTGSEVLTSEPRLTVPTKANDAPAPTTVPLDRSPASGLQRSSRDPCNSPAPVDQ